MPIIFKIVFLSLLRFAWCEPLKYLNNNNIMVSKLDVNSVECYHVFKDGNVFVRAFVNKKPAIALMKRLGRNRKIYVEVFYVFKSGKRVLVDFVN